MQTSDHESRTPILLVPGLGGAGPNHWLSRWQQSRPNCAYVRQNNWNIPDRLAWMSGLDRAIRACRTPPLLVAHSLGCALIVHWAAHNNESQSSSPAIQGALLVAPADVDSDEHTPAETRVFAPLPTAQLPFPATVVASTNDPYVDTKRAQVFATAWGAGFVNIGACGHINADSRLDTWDEGWELVQHLSDTKATLSRA